MTFGDAAGDIGRGLVAGAIGTAAMTVSSTWEAKKRERGSSSAPADAAGKVLGVQPRDEAGAARFGAIVHWGYGTGWGAARGALHVAGIGGIRATGIHFGVVWGGAQVMLPVLDVAPPPWKSPPQELGIDAVHHAVYAVATGLAFAALQHSAT